MANKDIYLEAPVRGASPYKDVVTPVLAGTEVFRIFAGRLEDVQNQHWSIARGAHFLTTSADVADRKIHHQLYAVLGANEYLLKGQISATNIVASKSVAFHYGNRVQTQDVGDYLAADGTDSTHNMGSFDAYLAKGQDYYKFSIQNGEAADLHYLIMTFKYLNYELGIEAKV